MNVKHRFQFWGYIDWRNTEHYESHKHFKTLLETISEDARVLDLFTYTNSFYECAKTKRVFFVS